MLWTVFEVDTVCTTASRVLFLIAVRRAFLQLPPSSSPDRLAEKILDLSVQAAQFILGPPVEHVHQVRREAQEEWLSLGHALARIPATGR